MLLRRTTWRRSWDSHLCCGWQQCRDFSTKKERKMIDDFIEYQDSLRNPDLITFLQRAKNILSSQWRCQLVTNSTAAKRDEKLRVSIVQYGFLQKPYICLTNKDKLHKNDLVMDSNVTIFVGHTDPPPLMETIKLLGKVPPHVIMTGVMAFAEENEVNRVKKEMMAVNAAAKEVVELGGQALGPLFEASQELLTSRFEAREELFKPETGTSMYLFRPKSCLYVDLTGEKHEVDMYEGLSPSMDTFSSLYAGLLEGINQSEARRFALKVFCMVYRHVKVEEALLYSIDRRGFDIFVKYLKGTSSDWKGYRFNFAKEIRGALELSRQLVEMEQDCWEAMRRSPVLASVVSRAAEAEAAAAAAESPEEEEQESQEAEAKDENEIEAAGEKNEAEAEAGDEQQSEASNESEGSEVDEEAEGSKEVDV